MPQVNRTGSGIHKDKRTKRSRAKDVQKRQAISESREQRDVDTKVTRPSPKAPYRNSKTNATQWNRWTP